MANGRGRHKWLRTIAGMYGVVATVMTPAIASGREPSGPGELAQAVERRSFDIPAQPLQSALIAFGQQAGRQVAADGAGVRGVASPGVHGTMSVDEALRRLLAGTGFTFDSAAGSTIAVQRIAPAGGAMQLDPVQVQGAFPVPSQAMIGNLPPPYAGGQVATGGQVGLLGDRDVMDTPFNQTSYTARKAQDQQARTVKEVLVDDPSVRAQRRDGGPGDDNVYIRGFQVGVGAAAYGGMYGILPSGSLMPEIAERIEVLKGPSAMLNGMSPYGGFIGGTVNIVPKRAPEQDLSQLAASYGSVGQVGGAADVARRFGENKQFGVRVNGAYRSGATDVQHNYDQRALGLIGLDLRGERVRFSGDFGYQYQNVNGVISYLGLANGVPLPYAPNAAINPGQPWSKQERKDLFGVARLEFDIFENLTAYAAFGAHDFRIGSLYPVRLQVTNFSGAATVTAPLNLSQYTTTVSGEAGIRGTGDTGPFHHEFSLIGTRFSEYTGVGINTSAGFASNLYNPTISVQPSIATPVATLSSTSVLSSYGVADTVSVADKRIQLTLGGRWQQVQVANYDPISGLQTSSYDQSAFSPSIAVLFKPIKNVSIYGNWIQGLQQGATVGPGFANVGETFPPYKATQYEAGIKVDWGKLVTTASLFQISQPSVITDAASNRQLLGGEQINRGLELNFFGEIVEGLRVLGGAMFLDAQLARTQGGATDGWTAPFSPGTQLNIGAEADMPFLNGLTFTGRVVYTGSQYIDTTLPRRSLPEWTRVDLGARYAFDNPAVKDRQLVLRFDVENVLGANYWEGGNAATTLFLGAPRSFRLSLAADF